MLPLWMVNNAAAIWLIAFAKQWMLLQCPEQKHIQITSALCLKVTVCFGKHHSKVNELVTMEDKCLASCTTGAKYSFTLNLATVKLPEVQISLLNAVMVTTTWQRSLWFLGIRRFVFCKTREYYHLTRLKKPCGKQGSFKLNWLFFFPLCRWTWHDARTAFTQDTYRNWRAKLLTCSLPCITSCLKFTQASEAWKMIRLYQLSKRAEQLLRRRYLFWAKLSQIYHFKTKLINTWASTLR